MAGGREGEIPVGDHLDEADGGKDREHATTGGSTPGFKGERMVELGAREVDNLLKTPHELQHT